MLTGARQLSDAEKLRKVVMELIDTERSYVKVRHTNKTRKKIKTSTSKSFFKKKKSLTF